MAVLELIFESKLKLNHKIESCCLQFLKIIEKQVKLYELAVLLCLIILITAIYFPKNLYKKSIIVREEIPKLILIHLLNKIYPVPLSKWHYWTTAHLLRKIKHLLFKVYSNYPSSVVLCCTTQPPIQHHKFKLFPKMS